MSTDVKETASLLSNILRETNQDWFGYVGVGENDGKECIIIYYVSKPPSSFNVVEYGGFKVRMSSITKPTPLEWTHNK